MANELDYEHGIPVTLAFAVANPAANTTTALTFAQGGAGFKVPTGYAFHAICLNGISNADLTAGTAAFKVCADGTALNSGPTATLSDTVQTAVGVKRVGVEPIAAGAVVSVKITTDANYAPNTADVDAILVGVLLPA